MEPDLDDTLVPWPAIADAVPGVVSLIDPQGCYEYANRTLGEWVGQAPEALRGRPVSEVLGAAAHAALRPHLTSALAGRVAAFEATVPYPAGTRVVRGSYIPHRAPDGRVIRVVGLLFDVTESRRAREAAELSERRYRFLADASEVLASSLQYEATIKAAVRLAVPALADVAGVDVTDEQGNPQRLAIAATEPGEERVVWEALHRYPPRVNDGHGVAKVLRTGQPEVFAEMTDEVRRAVAQDAEHLRFLREMDFRSSMLVPLNARGHTFGVLWLASRRSGRVFGPADLDLAQRLAERVALAVDNARLFRAAEGGRG